MAASMKRAVFWVVAPCSLVEVQGHALMMEAARTSESSVDFYQITRCYNPEASHLHKWFLVGFQVLTAASMKRAVFWVVAPCSLVEVQGHALMLEAARTSESSVDFYQTTRRYNPEDSHLHTWFLFLPVWKHLVITRNTVVNLMVVGCNEGTRHRPGE
jgi:hypothetical protein